MVRRFQATLVRPEGTGTWTFFIVPFDTSKEFGTKSKVQVHGTMDGLSYKGTLLPNGEGRHFMVVRREIRAAIGKAAGDKVNVSMDMDSSPRSVVLPEALRKALEGNADAKAAFNEIAYSHQKAYVDWIEQAKKKETREGRIRKTLKMILEWRKLKG